MPHVPAMVMFAGWLILITVLECVWTLAWAWQPSLGHMTTDQV